MTDRIKASWDEIIAYVRDEYELSLTSYNTWIKTLEVYKLRKEDSGNVLDVVIPLADPNYKGYMNKKYAFILAVAVEEITGIKCRINFISREEIESGIEKIKKTINTDSSKVDPGIIYRANLNPNYTFDSFVVGKSNNMAQAASLAVAESPGVMYNPLFIYGGVGLGKTHLMHAIANFILEKDPTKKVLYTTSENFTNEIVESMGKKNTSEFRNKYRFNDVLIIDDIQFIIGKNASQEEFFNTFNDMYGAKKQIIISSDKPPKEFDTLEERMKTRFEWGLSVDIQSPDYETRMAILRKKAEEKNWNIDNEVLKYIASNMKSNIRELEGALNRVIAMSRLNNGKEISIEFAKDVLKDLIEPDKKKKITSDTIIDIVCDHFNINQVDIISSKRNKELVVPRHVAMYLIKNLTDNSLDQIGKCFDGRDHSTVIHAVNKISTELGINQELKNTVDVLKKKLSAE